MGVPSAIIRIGGLTVLRIMSGPNYLIFLEPRGIIRFILPLAMTVMPALVIPVPLNVIGTNWIHSNSNGVPNRILRVIRWEQEETVMYRSPPKHGLLVHNLRCPPRRLPRHYAILMLLPGPRPVLLQLVDQVTFFRKQQQQPPSHSDSSFPVMVVIIGPWPPENFMSTIRVAEVRVLRRECRRSIGESYHPIPDSHAGHRVPLSYQGPNGSTCSVGTIVPPASYTMICGRSMSHPCFGVVWMVRRRHRH